jgi:hypothetical protein
MHEHDTEAIVPPRPMGANGIPDLPVEADVVKQPVETTPSDVSDQASSTAWIGWLAVGAVVVGTLGIFSALTRQPRRQRRTASLRAVPDPHAMTPPHGDKLMPSRLH